MANYQGEKSTAAHQVVHQKTERLKSIPRICRDEGARATANQRQPQEGEDVRECGEVSHPERSQERL